MKESEQINYLIYIYLHIFVSDSVSEQVFNPNIR